MFLVTPKPKANVNNVPNPLAIRPIAKITAPTKAARVQTACDRCRMKKVKCDGDLPCLRCTQDTLLCVTTKKVSNDPKGGLRDYVHSMESQQTRLIEALRKLHRHVKQPIEEKDMQEILQTVRACGFDVEGVQDIQNNAHQSNTPQAGHDNLQSFGNGAANGFTDNKDTNGENRNGVMGWATGHDCLGKRMRADYETLPNPIITPNSVVAPVRHVGGSLSDASTGSDMAFESQASPLKRHKPAGPAEMVGDYWKSDNNFDQVITPYNLSKPSTISGTPIPNLTLDANRQNVSNSSQQISEMPDWSWNDLSQPLTTTDDDPIFDINETTRTYPVMGSLEALSTFEAPHDWGSTMWWDPSLLFDTRLDSSDLDSGGLPTQSPELSHDVDVGSS